MLGTEVVCTETTAVVVSSVSTLIAVGEVVATTITVEPETAEKYEEMGNIMFKSSKSLDSLEPSLCESTFVEPYIMALRRILFKSVGLKGMKDE